MNNDLISREALKKHKFPINIADGVEIKEIEVVPVACINNAPTVKFEKAKEGELVKAYTKGFDTAVEIARTERPQGEWIVVSRNCWKCPFCQELTNEGKNYCSNCGASMKGGVE